jgi:ribonuclease HII
MDLLFPREYIDFHWLAGKFTDAKVVNSNPIWAVFASRKPLPPLPRSSACSSCWCSDAPEQALRYRGFTTIAGVDEVGRGALFGPVVAAAVILPRRMNALARAGLKDSKQLTREQREKLDLRIRKMALAVAVAEVDAETIDRVNIYQATRIAMLCAVQSLPIAPDHLLIDAMRLDHPCAQTRLFYGDALSLSIAAASVVAKVHRDGLMRDLDQQHPGYGLASHKGYGTPEHRRSLAALGACPLHRRSFAPVRAVLAGEAIPDAMLFDESEFDDPLIESALDDAILETPVAVQAADFA